ETLQEEILQEEILQEEILQEEILLGDTLQDAVRLEKDVTLLATAIGRLKNAGIEVIIRIISEKETVEDKIPKLF
ncbi:hypothetical protein V7161_05690, partial [Neobacillus drentensis]|uniref:hypothetical protein n=1 Tax=Neobacillus drentensis TaxID=220684 RepID=UPI002FFEED46